MNAHDEDLIEIRIDKLEEKLKIATEALRFINEIAPPMYQYNEVEIKMVFKAREALEKIKEIEK